MGPSSFLVARPDASAADANLSPLAQAAVSRLMHRLVVAQSPAAEMGEMRRPSWRRRNPSPGWNSWLRAAEEFANPRPPAAPARLDLTLNEYFAAAATIGLLASQLHEPDAAWASKWSHDFGDRMAREARRRRQKHRR